MTVLKDDSIKVVQRIYELARERSYVSYDISDLMKTSLYAGIRDMPNGKMKRACISGYGMFVKYWPNMLRNFVKDKGYVYPQGVAMMIRGLCELHTKDLGSHYLDEAIKLADWLLNNKSNMTKYSGWGQPFLWYSRMPFPANLPRSTVSSQVAHALLDLFDSTNDQLYLDICDEVCDMFIHDFNYKPDSNGNICFSYTVKDHYHIHNSNILAASVLFRLYEHTRRDELIDYGVRSLNFTLSHQNDDGSFYYWAPPDKLLYKIDNYHTGFVLEGFSDIKRTYCDVNLEKALLTGLDYYVSNLFDGVIPKMTPTNKYPIDIQSCAQGIITLNYDNSNKNYCELAFDIALYAMNKMYVEKNGHFGYRIYSNGYFDKNYYFRWGDSWMFRALANIM